MDVLYDVKYETSFLNDLELLNKTISKERFMKIIKQFNSKQFLLKRFPRMYQQLKIKKLYNEEYRKIILEKYIIIYKVNSSTISFLKIFHEKTNYSHKMQF